MSVCSDCHNPKPVARCVTTLNIGAIANPVLPNIDVYVYFNDTTIDRVVRYAVTTTPTGTINVPLTPQKISENHSYLIWVTKQTADNINIRENITISGEANNCIELVFQNIYTNDNVIATYATQILTL